MSPDEVSDDVLILEELMSDELIVEVLTSVRAKLLTLIEEAFKTPVSIVATLVMLLLFKLKFPSRIKTLASVIVMVDDM